MAALNDLRNGLVIRLNDVIYTIVDCQHVKPGKGGAFARTKLKRVTNGAVTDRTFRANETVETVRLEEREMQYMYNDGSLLYFMDNETFDQLTISTDVLGDAVNYLVEGESVEVMIYEGLPISVDLPPHVNLVVTQADPAVKGNTATGATKQVTMSTGLVLTVPLFIDVGDTLRVDTRDGDYVERV